MRHPDDGWHSLLLTMGRWAVARADAALVVQDAAALLAETLDADFSIVAKLTDDQRTFQVCLTPRGGTTAPITYQTPADDPQSLIGRVLTTGHPLAIADLAADSQAKDPSCSRPPRAGLILCPLRFFNQPFGALGVLTTKPREFRQRETLLVEVAAHFITTTIAHHRAEEALAAERESSEILLATVDALAIRSRRPADWCELNAAAERITGFSSAEVRDRPIFQRLAGRRGSRPVRGRTGHADQGRPDAKTRRLGADQIGRSPTHRLDLRPHAARVANRRSSAPESTSPPLRLANEELAVARATAATFQRQAEQHAQQLEKIRREVAWMESTPWSDGGPPAFMQIGDKQPQRTS